MHIPCAPLITDLYSWENILCNIQIGNIVHIGDLHKLTTYQIYLNVINTDYMYLMYQKGHNMYIVIDLDIKYISRVLFMSSYVSVNASFQPVDIHCV